MLFVPEESELIKKIPLSRHSLDDKLFQLWTQNGKYSCKSGYRFLKMEEEEEGFKDAQNGDKVFWRSIWGLRVPNKIKNFFWRTCREAIPTKANQSKDTLRKMLCANGARMRRKQLYMRCGLATSSTRYGHKRIRVLDKPQV